MKYSSLYKTLETQKPVTIEQITAAEQANRKASDELDARVLTEEKERRLRDARALIDQKEKDKLTSKNALSAMSLIGGSTVGGGGVISPTSVDGVISPHSAQSAATTPHSVTASSPSPVGGASPHASTSGGTTGSGSGSGSSGTTAQLTGDHKSMAGGYPHPLPHHAKSDKTGAGKSGRASTPTDTTAAAGAKHHSIHSGSGLSTTATIGGSASGSVGGAGGSGSGNSNPNVVTGAFAPTAKKTSVKAALDTGMRKTRTAAAGMGGTGGTGGVASPSGVGVYDGSTDAAGGASGANGTPPIGINRRTVRSHLLSVNTTVATAKGSGKQPHSASTQRETKTVNDRKERAGSFAVSGASTLLGGSNTAVPSGAASARPQSSHINGGSALLTAPEPLSPKSARAAAAAAALNGHTNNRTRPKTEHHHNSSTDWTRANSTGSTGSGGSSGSGSGSGSGSASANSNGFLPPLSANPAIGGTKTTTADSKRIRPIGSGGGSGSSSSLLQPQPPSKNPLSVSSTGGGGGASAIHHLLLPGGAMGNPSVVAAMQQSQSQHTQSSLTNAGLAANQAAAAHKEALKTLTPRTRSKSLAVNKTQSHYIPSNHARPNAAAAASRHPNY